MGMIYQKVRFESEVDRDGVIHSESGDGDDEMVKER